MEDREEEKKNPRRADFLSIPAVKDLGRLSAPGRAAWLPMSGAVGVVGRLSAGSRGTLTALPVLFLFLSDATFFVA